MAQGFGAQLDDLLLRLHVGPRTPIQIETAPIQANRIQTSVDRQEFVSDFGETWARSDFTGGEGLDWAHRPNLTDRDDSRFWDSKGVRVARPSAGVRRELGLLSDTENILALAGAPQMAVLGSTLFVSDGTNVQVSTDPTGAAGWSVENPNAAEAAAAVAGLAVLGDQVYAALGANGVHRRDNAGTWAHYSGLTDAVGVWAAKGRVFVSTGESLYEVTDSAPTPVTALRTLPPGHTWVDVVDAGMILGAASDGYVYAWDTDDAGDLTLVEQTLFQHETPTCLGESQGSVFLGTVQGTIGRLWRAVLDDSGHLVGEVIREWQGAAPHGIAADREQVYTAVVEDGETHAWRYDVTEAAMFRHYVYADPGATELARVNGVLVAAVDGSGVWRPTSEFVAEGWLIGPLADFYSADVKLWVAASLDTGTLPDGTEATLWFTTDPDGLSDPDHSSWVRAMTANAQNPTGEEAPLANIAGRALAGMVRLSASADRLAEPTVQAFGFRAYLSEPDVVVTLPVNVSDIVAMPGRSPLRVPGRGAQVYQYLRDREGESALLQLFRPAETVRGVVASVGAQVPVLTRRGSQTAYALVQVRGRRVSLSGSAVDGTFGAGTFGSLMFGGASGG